MNPVWQSSFNNYRRGIYPVPPPLANGAVVAPEDAYETDDEGGSDDEYSDSSDEEVTGSDRAEQDAGDASTPSESDNLTENLADTKSANDADESAAKPPVSGRGHNAQAGQTEQENKFVAALMKAAGSYSERLRVPSSLSTPPKLPQALPTPCPSRPEYVHEVLSDDSDDSDSEKESGSSTDQFDDIELLSGMPKFDGKQATQLLYHPETPWSDFIDAPIENAVVIATLHAGAMCEAYIKEGILGGRKITYISKTWLVSQKWEGFSSELALYQDPEYLRTLQGSVIPKIIGLYLVEGAISVAMELPSSDFWVEASEDMSNHLKRRCISAFDKIHERGVLHNDVELRHMLINSSGDAIIIDFQESRALRPVESIGLKAATEADIRLEKRKLRFKLNFQDSRECEIAKINRVTKWEERKRVRHISRAKRAGASAHSKAPAERDEESEPEDPDDVLNPIVDPQTWINCWIGEPFTPTCYIVPGQDRIQVTSAMEEFVMEELDRQSGDVTVDGDERVESDLEGETGPDPALLSPALPLVPTPILPTRINFKKRSRDESDDTSNDANSPKKRLCNPFGAKTSELASDTAPMSDPLQADPAPLVNSSSITPSPTPSSIPVTRRPLVPDIHVPFEGYTGVDGFIIPNIYSSDELAILRKCWIQQYNINRSLEDELPYPIAELENLVPSTMPEVPYRINSKGKKKKIRPMRNRGALLRKQIDNEDPNRRRLDAMQKRLNYIRNRKEIGTGLSDSEDEEDALDSDASDDGIPEGGRIMTFRQLESDSSRYFSGVYSSPFPSFAPAYEKPREPSKSILRRQLAPWEKARNVACLEQYDKRRRQESDGEIDLDNDSQRPTKRARTSRDPPNIPTVLSPDRVNVPAPNALADRPVNNGWASVFRFRLPSFLSSHPSVSTVASSVEANTNHSPVSLNASPSEPTDVGDQSSGRSSTSTGSASDALSESDLGSDGDKGPSSSVWPPLRKRRHDRSRRASNSGAPRPFGIEITLEELARLRTASKENVCDIDTLKRRAAPATKDDEARVGFRLNIPWRWPTSKR